MTLKPTISEKELKRQLAGLREEVAAPANFRASILKRLAEETGQAVPESQATLWRRMLDFVSRPGLVPALGATLALALGFWFATRPQPAHETIQALHPTTAPAASSAKPVTVASARPLKHAPHFTAKAPQLKPKPEQAALAPAPLVAEAQTAAREQAAPALGDSSGTSNTSQTKFGSMPAENARALGQSSQVRRNKFMASKGEYAAIVFKITAPGHTRVEIYDRMGNLVALLHDADHDAGTFEVRWFGYGDDGQLQPTGIYLVRITTPEYHDSHKIVLVR